MNWHIVTGEYPPDSGGVADYTALLAGNLASAGAVVHVWANGGPGSEPVPGVTVHRTSGRFGPADLRQLSRDLNRFPKPRTVLVQYVPHMYGYRAMNLPFAGWVWSRRHADDVRIMFHEVSYPYVRLPLKHNVIATANRLMAWLLLRAARRVYVSTPAWLPQIRQLGYGRAVWLPIPSTLPAAPPIRPTAIPVVGHFGTYSPLVGDLLAPAVETILRTRDDVHVVFIGGGSDRFRESFLRDRPGWENRVSATGRVTASEAAGRIAGCDVLLQPYPDGANSRRTSLMAGLAAGVAVVSTAGENTEDDIASAAATVPSGHEAAAVLEFLADPVARAATAVNGLAVYESHFNWPRTVRILTRP